jgi:hypothetical protein
MKFEVEKEVLDNIANYLIKRPYCEVAQLLMTLNQSIKPIEEKEELPKPVKEVKEKK